MSMENKREVRCVCGKLLFYEDVAKGTVWAKCPRCKTTNKINFRTLAGVQDRKSKK